MFYQPVGNNEVHTWGEGEMYSVGFGKGNISSSKFQPDIGRLTANDISRKGPKFLCREWLQQDVETPLMFHISFEERRLEAAKMCKAK